jgi:hypothetical protein
MLLLRDLLAGGQAFGQWLALSFCLEDVDMTQHMSPGDILAILVEITSTTESAGGLASSDMSSTVTPEPFRGLIPLTTPVAFGGSCRH